jgi:hypothetical protein
MKKIAPKYLANFDSASAMVRSLSRFLHGKGFPALGIASEALLPLGLLLNRMPRTLRESFYIWSGFNEAIPARRLPRVRAERIAQWAVSQYPQRRYQAVAIGSSSGALVHLCAALGIPWLPQTFLIPVRRLGVHPDRPREDLEFGKQHAAGLLEANPEIQLHHMNDANQDRLMIERMTYFRIKWRALSAAYEEFLLKNLPPGGTILVSDCRLRWPVLNLGPRHIFQHGALGGATPEEFLEGSPRVAAYLERYDSPHRVWDSPGASEERPEAEWGFEEALMDDIHRVARRQGYRIRRLTFHEPEDLSPMVAEFYRRQYRQRGMPDTRLLAESFLVHEPFWTLRTGSVPFWMTFNKEPSAELLQRYLDWAQPPFDEVYLMLFSHGVESVGLVPIDHWQAIIQQARKRSGLIGVDPERYPRDFAVFLRYQEDLKRTIPARYPMAGPVLLDEFDDFLRNWADDGSREWQEDKPLTWEPVRT